MKTSQPPSNTVKSSRPVTPVPFLVSLGLGFILLSAQMADAAAPNVVTILQGQSNAVFMQDGYNNYHYQNVFQPMVLGLTGVAQVNAYANRYASANGLSLYSG